MEPSLSGASHQVSYQMSKDISPLSSSAASAGVELATQ
jgi:hypothetical protein